MIMPWVWDQCSYHPAPLTTWLVPSSCSGVGGVFKPQPQANVHCIVEGIGKGQRLAPLALFEGGVFPWASGCNRNPHGSRYRLAANRWKGLWQEQGLRNRRLNQQPYSSSPSLGCRADHGYKAAVREGACDPSLVPRCPGTVTLCPQPHGTSSTARAVPR